MRCLATFMGQDVFAGDSGQQLAEHMPDLEVSTLFVKRIVPEFVRQLDWAPKEAGFFVEGPIPHKGGGTPERSDGCTPTDISGYVNRPPSGMALGNTLARVVRGVIEMEWK
jgi:hypothetical protein